ncbi:abkC, partial [Symbiodinium pilosum]
ASIWRLLQLAVIMLPVAIYFPVEVWIIDPSTFWSLVSDRIDRAGPCFVKLAQWAATRRDLFPDSLCAALGRMHESVSAPWSTAIEPSEVCSSLRNAELDIQSLDSRPYASGSMAEVYFGKLRDGTEVAVKCLRPGVKRLLEADLALLLCFGNWAESLEPLRMLGLKKAAEEFCEHVQMQTDFRTEASHLQRFRENFEELGSIRFPSPLYASQELLVLSREMGRELSRVFRDAMTFDGPEEKPDSDRFESHAGTIRSILGIPEEVSQRIASDSLAAYMRMIFKDHFIHGDLHPGNVMLKLQSGGSSSSSGQASAQTEEASSLIGKASDHLSSVVSRARGQPFELIILDAGLAIPLPSEKVEALRSLALAIIYGDFNRAAQILYDQSPDTSNCQDPQAFKSGLAKAFCDCRKQVYEDGFVQVSDAVLESLRLVRQYNVGLDTTLTWTLLGMLSIEGSARQLDPEVDCARAATRYILNMPSLRKELQSQSWHTSKHMFTEMLLNWFGIDYWEWRNSWSAISPWQMGKS